MRLSRFTAFFLGVLLALTSPARVLAQSFNTLLLFDGNNGETPYWGPPIQGQDGNLYGMTTDLELPDGGAVFRMTPDGVLTRIYVFCTQDNDCSDGQYPMSLIQGSDGNFYGTTAWGGRYKCGPQGCGIVFRLTPGGELTVIHNFGWHDGAFPLGLIEARDGSLYGVTSEGGTGVYAYGTIFRISKNGFQRLYSFCPEFGCVDGSGPSSLVQASNGVIYGTTTSGGKYGMGSIFRLKASGKPAILHNFSGTDGYQPLNLIQGIDGRLYGVTYFGGDSQACDLGCGTVFMMKPTGEVTTLVSFDSDNGANPLGLLQANDKNIYGSTFQGGNPLCADGCGTIFRISRAGKLTTLYKFSGKDDGALPSPLFQHTAGILYGSTRFGPINGWGTIFDLDMQLPPFVALANNAGRAGQSGGILGQGFTGATAVALNGAPATFEIVSDTFIRATVPVGATTGYVTVTTSSGTLTSNRPFIVLP